MEEQAPKDILLRSAYRLFTALARVLLRYAVSAAEAERVLRRAFVEVAAADYGVRGRPTSKARIAALTGLSRKEVSALLDEAPQDSAERAAPNRAIRVISAWLREPAYLDHGQPRVLPFSGAAPSFEALAAAHSGDVPPRALLRDLERTGVVECADDHIRLVERGFVPRGDNLALLPLIGDEPTALLHTIDHNLQAGSRPRRFQRKAAFTALDAAGLEKLATFAATRGQALLEEIDALLAPHHDEHARDTPRHHAGLALHVFVDPHDSPIAPPRRGTRNAAASDAD